MEIKAYAKVNLTLSITGVRNDGYHLIDTVMQTVDLYDVIRITKRSDGEITVNCDCGDINGESNICYFAAKEFFCKTGEKGGADIYITKNIPTAAGLGGGSSDAAATLCGLNELYGNILDKATLCELALRLGADVPFFISGGTARVTGIGEQIVPFKALKPVFLLLIKDKAKPSTAAMYKKIDELGISSQNEGISDLCVKSLISGDFDGIKTSFANDFNAVCDYENVKRDMLGAGASGVSLSGSGPTVMGLFKSSQELYNAYDKLKGKYACIFAVKSKTE